MHEPSKRPDTSANFFRPVTASGRVLFFDYHKNKFGIITQITTENGEAADKARIDERGLATKTTLTEGSMVLFTLCRGRSGFYATKVRTEEELSLSELLSNIHLVSFSAMQKQLERKGNEAAGALPLPQLEKLLDYLFDQRHPAAWHFLHEFKPGLTPEYFSKHYGDAKQGVPMAYLKKAFDPLVFNLVGSGLNSALPPDVLEYLSIGIKQNVNYENIPEQFWYGLKRADIKYHELKKYQETGFAPIREKLLNLVPLKDYSTPLELSSIFKPNGFSEQEIRILQERFKREFSARFLQEAVTCFTLLRSMNVYENSDPLEELVTGQNLTYQGLVSLLTSPVSATFKESTITSAFEPFNEQLSIPDRLDLTRRVVSSPAAGPVLAACFLPGKMSQEQFKLFFTELSKAAPAAAKYFLEKHFDYLQQRLPGRLFNLSLKANWLKGIVAGLEAYQPAEDKELGGILDRLQKHPLFPEIKQELPALAALLEPPLTAAGFSYTKPLNFILNKYGGSAESFVIKWLVSLYHQQRLTQAQLQDAVGAYYWKTMSALLIQAFINLQDTTDEFVLKTLTQVMHRQFNHLAAENLSKKEMLGMMQIGNVLTRCNGRTMYNFQRETVNGRKRLVIQHPTPHFERRDARDCFCEGRIWLKDERFYIEPARKDTETVHNLYWCGTQHCAKINDQTDLTQPFYNWTLYDIAKVLQVQVTTTAMTTLSGWANRMNSITERLICRQCNEILRPLPFEAKILGFYAVPVFQCINTECSEHAKPIRFTHCLNGKCAKTLDSRDNRSCCSSGLLCRYCNTSCPRCHGREPVRVGII